MTKMKKVPVIRILDQGVVPPLPCSFEHYHENTGTLNGVDLPESMSESTQILNDAPLGAIYEWETCSFFDEMLSEKRVYIKGLSKEKTCWALISKE